jgi:predicted DNA-binding transcriptional regulator YafY
MRPANRRRPSIHVTLNRAARLHRMVTILAAEPKGREVLLAELGVGLRTFYRELEFLRRCGIRIRLAKRLYTLRSTAEEADGRLPFPDPQLSFAEMAELARCPGPAARRLAEMLAKVTGGPTVEAPTPKPSRRRKAPPAPG